MTEPGLFTRRRAASLIAALGLFTLASGCIFLRPVERDYLSNRPIFEAVARAAGYEVPTDLFTLTAVDLREDSVTFQYRGLPYPGDSAWVVRFSQKSTEQDPVALADVYSLLPLLAESREHFKIIEEGDGDGPAGKVRYVLYGFDSSIRDREGTPFRGHGIVTAFSIEQYGETVVFQLKLDNQGDRETVGWKDLEPFLRPLRAR